MSTAKKEKTGTEIETGKNNGRKAVPEKIKNGLRKIKRLLGRILRKIRSRKLYTVLAIVAVIAVLVLLAGLAIRYIFPAAKGFTVEEDASFTDPVDAGDPDLNEQIDMLSELRASGDLFDLLKGWAQTDTGNSLMQSKDVINVLLVGVDASGGNSDAIMLASVNKKNSTITLSSIMRDSYTFMDTPVGEAAGKINAAYANGGMECLIDTVQNDYKIKIDHYFCVNFRTFVEVVDIIGGVAVPVKDYERRAMNGLAEWNSEYLYESGDSVLLNGRQALLYCRIRKYDEDGDVSRTRRQRQFMTALINAAKELTASDLPDLAKTLHKYVSTDCAVAQLVSLGTQALSGKWYRYNITSLSYPLPENRMDYSGHAWVWIVDYPADAKAMQEQIYGTSNIQLSEDRRTAMDIVRSGEF